MKDKTKSNGPATMLLVDDEEMIRNLLSRALCADKHNVVAVASAKEAFEQLAQTRFDLLIVDKNLPDGSGLSVVEAARNLRLDSESIVITGYSDTDSAIQAVALGVFRYVRKPFDLDALKVDISRALETGRLRRALAQRTAQLELANANLEDALSKAREAENRRVQAERLATIGSLAAGVAHEINNPLSMLSMSIPYAASELDTILRTQMVEAAPDEAVAELGRLAKALRQTQEAVEFLIGLSSDLHSLGKPVSPQPRPVKIADVVGSALRLVRHQLKHKARIVVDVPEELTVRGQQRRLVQVFINLLTNAGRAVRERGPDQNEISVCGRLEGQRAVIEVSDTGVGIAPEDLDHIFDRFFTTAEDTAEGAGIGLAIVREIVDDHGGAIDVRSAVGEGTRFTLRLPAAESASSRATVSVVTRSSTAAMIRARRRILFVDSEAENLAAYERAFGQMHSVVLAHGIADARRVLEESRDEIDAVVCELTPDDPFRDTWLAAGAEEQRDLRARTVLVGEPGPIAEEARAQGLIVLYKPVRPAVLLAEIYRIPPRKPSDATESPTGGRD
jgi:signal transduction histidine kinase